MDIERDGVKINLDCAPVDDTESQAATVGVSFEAHELGLVLPLGNGAVSSATGSETEQQVGKAELTVADIKADLAEQLAYTYTGYSLYLDAVNQQRTEEEVASQLTRVELGTHFHDWLAEREADGALDYVKEQMEADPDLQFTLVAQPNIEVTSEELKYVAQGFAEGMPHQPYVYDELYNGYEPEELSGVDVTQDEAGVRFLLIPSKFSPTADTAKNQQTALEELKEDRPYIVVPAPAVAPNFWYTLRASGKLPHSKDPADFVDTVEKTGIRHFNLDAQELDGFLSVPYSYINVVGQPSLGGSNAQGDGYTRDAVG